MWVVLILGNHSSSLLVILLSSLEEVKVSHKVVILDFKRRSCLNWLNRVKDFNGKLNPVLELQIVNQSELISHRFESTLLDQGN